jgi:hypothetical protein
MSDKTLTLIPYVNDPRDDGAIWGVEHAGSDQEALVLDLFGGTLIPTPFPASMPAEQVIAKLSAIPANDGYTFKVVQ